MHVAIHARSVWGVDDILFYLSLPFISKTTIYIISKKSFAANGREQVARLAGVRKCGSSAFRLEHHDLDHMLTRHTIHESIHYFSSNWYKIDGRDLNHL